MVPPSLHPGSLFHRMGASWRFHACGELVERTRRKQWGCGYLKQRAAYRWQPEFHGWYTKEAVLELIQRDGREGRQTSLTCKL